jgi:hypothetical protein
MHKIQELDFQETLLIFLKTIQQGNFIINAVSQVWSILVVKHSKSGRKWRDLAHLIYCLASIEASPTSGF